MSQRPLSYGGDTLGQPSATVSPNLSPTVSQTGIPGSLSRPPGRCPMSGPGMEPVDLMERSGAVRCDDHGRWECTAKSSRSQERCHAPAIRGMSKCRIHCGRSAVVAKALGEANLAAWSTQAAAGMELTALDPGRVVLEQLRLSVMRADLYGQMLRWQMDSMPDGEELDGLIGKTHAVSRESQRVETGERVRGLAQLEAQERDRVVRFAKTAHDMGIAEAQVQLEQEKAQIVTAAFLGALGDVSSLLPADRDVLLRGFLSRLGRGPEVLAAGAVTS